MWSCSEAPMRGHDRAPRALRLLRPVARAPKSVRDAALPGESLP